MKNPSEIYTAEWFVKDFDHFGVKEDFFLIADAIYRQFGPRAVVDYGCGPGMILERLLQHGVLVKGYEGSEHGVAHAAPSVKHCIEHVDLTTMPADPCDRYPDTIVICTEVAEHLEAEYAPHLVALLCQHMCPIIFTAAPPGQGGHDHVNEQPAEYWLDLFAAHGVILDEVATAEMQQRWRKMRALHHMPKNVMVLR